jgi:phosphoglycerate dehydrogenase-like enzyme
MRDLPRQVLVLGLGAIGKALAARLRALGIRVLGCARTDSADRRSACDELVPAAQWRDVLGRVDAVVLALPLSDDTRGMFGAAELNRLPDGALIVNVARAGLLDLDALRAALRSGKIAAAAVDLLDPIPAPGDSLWQEPGLIVTPKVAAYHPAMQRDFERFVEMQLSRYLQGEPLHAVVPL